LQPLYRVHDGTGPYLLLVHGFLTSSAQWLDNLDALGKLTTPVTIDLYGHGDSPAPDDANAYRPEAYVAALDAIRTDLGVDRMFLCGYSLGAGLTLRYALTYPERVIGQVFTNSSSGLADVSEQTAWRSGALHAAGRIREGGLAAIEAIAVHPRHAKHLPHSVYQALMRDAARLDPIGIANTLSDTNPYASVRARLGENTVPTLLACGSRERRFQAKRNYAASTMPHLTIADLPVGHGVNMEDPTVFNSAVTAFLQSLLR